ncbi:MAG: hypothetical protein IPM13_10670 [Phycisphaerales bacterium]|nr:hypothetical protein [Phycisphaerales bacterium]
MSMMFLGFTSRWMKPRLVGVQQGLSDLRDDLDRFLLGVHLAVGQLVVDRAALDELHDEVVKAVGLADVDGLDNVVVVELRRRPPLAVEARDELGVLAQPLRQHLHRDDAVEAELLAAVDDRHRAGAALVEKLVSRDLLRRPPPGILARSLEAQELRPRQEAEVHEHVGQRARMAAVRHAPLLLGGDADLLRCGELPLNYNPGDLGVVE